MCMKMGEAATASVLAIAVACAMPALSDIVLENDAFRLVRAGRLLRETDSPIGLIAEQSGFGSIYPFSRRFKKLLGISPKEYRISKNAKAKKKG